MEKHLDVCKLHNLPNIYPQFSKNIVLNWRRNGDKNGFNKCTYKLGGSVFVDLVKFDAWVKGGGN